MNMFLTEILLMSLPERQKLEKCLSRTKRTFHEIKILGKRKLKSFVETEKNTYCIRLKVVSSKLYNM